MWLTFSIPKSYTNNISINYSYPNKILNLKVLSRYNFLYRNLMRNTFRVSKPYPNKMCMLRLYPVTTFFTETLSVKIFSIQKPHACALEKTYADNISYTKNQILFRILFSISNLYPNSV